MQPHRDNERRELSWLRLIRPGAGGEERERGPYRVRHATNVPQLDALVLAVGDQVSAVALRANVRDAAQVANQHTRLAGRSPVPHLAQHIVRSSEEHLRRLIGERHRVDVVVVCRHLIVCHQSAMRLLVGDWRLMSCATYGHDLLIALQVIQVQLYATSKHCRWPLSPWESEMERWRDGERERERERHEPP